MNLHGIKNRQSFSALILTLCRTNNPFLFPSQDIVFCENSINSNVPLLSLRSLLLKLTFASRSFLEVAQTIDFDKKSVLEEEENCPLSDGPPTPRKATLSFIPPVSGFVVLSDLPPPSGWPLAHLKFDFWRSVDNQAIVCPRSSSR